MLNGQSNRQIFCICLTYHGLFTSKRPANKLGMFIQSCACSYETTAFNDQMNLKSGPHGLWQFMPDSYPTDNYTNPTIGCNTVPKDS